MRVRISLLYFLLYSRFRVLTRMGFVRAVAIITTEEAAAGCDVRSATDGGAKQAALLTRHAINVQTRRRIAMLESC